MRRPRRKEQVQLIGRVNDVFSDMAAALIVTGAFSFPRFPFVF